MTIPLIYWVVQSPIYPKQPGALFSLLNSELSVFRKFLQSRRVGTHAPCTSVRKNHLKQKIQHLQLCRKATPIIILRNINKHVFKTNTDHPERKKIVKQSSCEKPKRLRFAKNSHGKFFGKHNDSKVHNPTITTPFSPNPWFLHQTLRWSPWHFFPGGWVPLSKTSPAKGHRAELWPWNELHTVARLETGGPTWRIWYLVKGVTSPIYN